MTIQNRRSRAVRESEHKPLSFNTTIRNPERIPNFISILVQFEGQILTNDLIMQIVAKLISKKLYRPNYIGRVARLKEIYNDPTRDFTDDDVINIIENSPQNHKETGFDKGWPSRFDTQFKLPMELGFVYYSIGEPIIVSRTGHLLVEASEHSNQNGDVIPENGEQIQKIYLNSMMKYQACNPFRRNLNDNVPLILLLQVIKLLRDDPDENDAGIYRKEISLFICWPNNDAFALYNHIKQIRRTYRFSYSDEIMYDICMSLLNAGPEKRRRFKMSQITGELVDEFIRKMRMTGLISLRGRGFFIDFNTFEQIKIDYIVQNYNTYQKFEEKIEYFNYMGEIDENVVNLPTIIHADLNRLRIDSIIRYSREYESEYISSELLKLCNRRASDDILFKEIPGPLRLEFLVSICLKQHFTETIVSPNYVIDDEGLPIHTAGGGVADISCFDNQWNSLFEVSLIVARNQVTDEIIPINRHQLDAKIQNPNTFSVFIAPTLHPDAIRATEWIQSRDGTRIISFDINTFLNVIQQHSTAQSLIVN